MQSEKTPKGQQSRNVIKVEKARAKDQTQYTIQYEMSDLAFQQFQGFSQAILNIQINEMQLLSKQLDKPLSMFSKFGASIFGIKTKHQFLLFDTHRFLMTIDFYEGNKIRIRVGDPMKVFETETSQQRKHSTIVKTEQGLQWRRHFKESQIFVKDILDCLKHKQLQRAHSKISFNGSHFSRKLWNDIVKIAQSRK